MDFFALKKVVSYLFAPIPLVVLMLTVACLGAWLTRASAWVKIPLSVAWIFMVLLPVSPIPTQGLLYYERLYPTYQPKDHSLVEQILVLACYVTDDEALPITAQHHPCSRGRLIEAMRIWQLHPNAQIVLSGGSMRFGHTSMAQKGADFLQALGVPEDKLLVIAQGRDTESEAVAYKPYFKAGRAVLVTSGTHMKRAVRLFARYGMRVIPAPAELLILSTASAPWDWKSWVPTAAVYYRVERLWYATLANALVTLQSIFSNESEELQTDVGLLVHHQSDELQAELAQEQSRAIKQFTHLLESQEFSKAMVLYEEQLKTGLEQSYVEAAYEFLATLIELAPEQALLLSQQFLALDFDNPHWHFWSLASSARTFKYPQAMEELIYFRDAYIPEYLSESVQKLRKKVISDYSEQLLVSSELEPIEKLVEQLDFLHEVSTLQKLQQKIKQLERSEYLSSLYAIQLPLKVAGNHHLVEATLNNAVTINLMLDTGASQVAIARDVIESIAYQLKKERKLFNTANAKVNQDIVTVALLQVGEVELAQFDVSVMDNYSSSVSDGLLGQNFLSLFDWKIDQEANVLHLNPK